MDEPFGALDAMTREQLNLQLQDVHMKQGKTILFVTHNIQEAVFLSDRILVMSSGPGRVVADLPVTFSRPRDSNIYLKDEFRELERNIRDLLEDPERSSAESSEAVHAV
jgi:NitT/TauT family transport system ATP-binding protein